MSEASWSTTGGEENAQDKANKTDFEANIEYYRVIVVGGGLGGYKICESLIEEYELNTKNADCVKQVCLITKENDSPYDHSGVIKLNLHSPGLEKSPLEEKLSLPTEESFYSKHGIVLKTNFEVTMLQPEYNSITITPSNNFTAKGKVLRYDKIVFATGMRYKASIGRLKEIGCFHTLNHKQDAVKIVELVKKLINPRILIIGNNLDAVQAALALSTWLKDGYGHVQLISEKKKLCDEVLSGKGSNFLKTFLEGKGVQLKLGCKINTIYGFEMTFNNGNKTTFDFGLEFSNGYQLNSDALFRHKLKLGPYPCLGLKVNDKFQAEGFKNIYVGGNLSTQRIGLNLHARALTVDNVVKSSQVIAKNCYMSTGSKEPQEPEHEYRIVPQVSETINGFNSETSAWEVLKIDHFGSNKKYRSCKYFGFDGDQQSSDKCFGSVWVNEKNEMVGLTVWNYEDTTKCSQLLNAQYDKEDIDDFFNLS